MKNERLKSKNKKRYIETEISESSKQKIYKYTSFFVIFDCIIVRCYFYIQSKFFWQDEALLFFSLYKTDFLSVITQNNIYFQTYPSLFGVLSWIIIHLFGVSVYALRLFPFLSSCLFFVLLYFVANEIKNEKYATICLAISMFNLILLNYSDEFKQYSLEACVTLLLILYYAKNLKSTYITYKFIILSIVSILLSVPAPFIVLTLILCFYVNYIKSNKVDNFFVKTLLFTRYNFLKLIILSVFSVVYYYYCLKNGDANNGDAWKSGMIPEDYTRIIEWLYCNFFVILSRLMSNSHRLFEGAIFLIFSFVGVFFIVKRNHPLSLFVKCFIPIFITSLWHVYSLGNILWGTYGARLSIYILPILILTSGCFVYRMINILCFMFLTHIKVKYIRLFKNITSIEENPHVLNVNFLASIAFIIICFYLSIYTILCMNEWHYDNCKSNNELVALLQRENQSKKIAHSSAWYSLEFYKIYKQYNFKIEKLGNQTTRKSEFPPISKTFTSGFVDFMEKFSLNKKFFVFVQKYSKDRIYKFIDEYGFVIQCYNFGEIYVLECKK